MNTCIGVNVQTNVRHLYHRRVARRVLAGAPGADGPRSQERPGALAVTWQATEEEGN